MIKNGRYGVYKNMEYKINEDMEGNLLIITSEKEKIDSSFVDKFKTGVYSKVINSSELESAYEVRMYGLVDGYKVNVTKENEEYYFIETGDCKVAEILGLSRCDKYYYEGKVDKNKMEIFEERKALKL